MSNKLGVARHRAEPNGPGNSLAQVTGPGGVAEDDILGGGG